MIQIKSYGLETSQGPHLNLNEDLVDVDILNNLFLTIDGFGGSNIGDVVAIKVRDAIKKSYTKISKDPDSTLPFFYSHKYLIEGNALINAFQAAHQTILKDNDLKDLNLKGGASVVAAALAENILTVVSTGNCSTYLFRKGKLSLEIVPDSLDSLSRDRFLKSRQSIPISGIGLFEDLHYQVREIKLREGDLVLLLTDGSCSRVDLDEVRHIIDSNLGDELEILNQLFKISNERGNLDNQSGIVLQF